VVAQGFFQFRQELERRGAVSETENRVRQLPRFNKIRLRIIRDGLVDDARRFSGIVHV